MKEKDIKLLDDINMIVTCYKIMIQIKQPSKEWVIAMLKSIDPIKEIEAVTFNNDPNDMLGKEGGYSECIYFSLKDVDGSKIPGTTIIEKGTDAGGAIEIYRKLKDAQNRCEYLSEFDGTLLYSGSYTLFGTMVIRTSYQLTNEEQVAMVNTIIEKMIE